MYFFNLIFNFIDIRLCKFVIQFLNYEEGSFIVYDVSVDFNSIVC